MVLPLRPTGGKGCLMRRGKMLIGIKRVWGDMEDAAWFLKFYAGSGCEIKGESIPSTSGNYHFTVREPYGVVGKSVPFNHPILFASRIGAPLIVGYAVVLKPPREASLSTCLFAEICREVMPPGVVNIMRRSSMILPPGRKTGPACGRRDHASGRPVSQRVLDPPHRVCRCDPVDAHLPGGDLRSGSVRDP